MKSRLGSRPYELATRRAQTLFARARRPSLALALAAAAALFSSCHSTRPHPGPEVEPVAAPTQQVDLAPSWLTQPLSEEKLRAIETWLVTDGTKSSPLWRIEGELVLNLGRLEFARRATVDKSANDATLPSQLRTARAGLERVTADIDATTAQRRRAQDGMARSDKLIAQLSPRKVTGTAVIARATWGAAKARADRMDKNKGGYTRITVHHSADPNPVELDGSQAKTFEAVREIQKAHMDGKSTHYGDIGYHFVIDPYGRVIEGRELTYQGAHAYGDNNIQNIGICLIGNFDVEKPTQSALDALQRTIDDLRTRYDIPKSQVFGHREMPRATDCPGKNLMKWIVSYRGGAAAVQAKASATQTDNERTATKRAPKGLHRLSALH